MLAATPKTMRFLERVQLVLTFASVCAVVDASLVHAQPSEPAGYHAGNPQRNEAERDRLAGDLARSERKRREAALRDALEERQLRA